MQVFALDFTVERVQLKPQTFNPKNLVCLFQYRLRNKKKVFRLENWQRKSKIYLCRLNLSMVFVFSVQTPVAIKVGVVSQLRFACCFNWHRAHLTLGCDLPCNGRKTMNNWWEKLIKWLLPGSFEAATVSFDCAKKMAWTSDLFSAFDQLLVCFTNYRKVTRTNSAMTQIQVKQSWCQFR